MIESWSRSVIWISLIRGRDTASISTGRKPEGTWRQHIFLERSVQWELFPPEFLLFSRSKSQTPNEVNLFDRGHPTLSIQVMILTIRDRPDIHDVVLAQSCKPRSTSALITFSVSLVSVLQGTNNNPRWYIERSEVQEFVNRLTSYTIRSWAVKGHPNWLAIPVLIWQRIMKRVLWWDRLEVQYFRQATSASFRRYRDLSAEL